MTLRGNISFVEANHGASRARWIFGSKIFQQTGSHLPLSPLRSAPLGENRELRGMPRGRGSR